MASMLGYVLEIGRFGLVCESMQKAKEQIDRTKIYIAILTIVLRDNRDISSLEPLNPRRDQEQQGY
jgi:hypothetical protein